MLKSIFYGMIASLFFASAFLLNSSMSTSGGNWMWSASLRYIFMLPILFLILVQQRNLKKVFETIKKDLFRWILWSTVGFGVFYAPLTFASAYGESWLVAGCWQMTIVAGILLTPFFKQKLPVKNLCISFIILIGVFIIQYEQAQTVTINQVLLSILPIIIAAFAYPLGNRKMMQVCNNELTTAERVFCMTLCSLPFWIILSIIAVATSGFPQKSQITQSLIVALFSGVIATILFFKATELVKHNATKLAIVEATQSGEVLFTVLGEIIIFHGKLPTPIGFLGLFLIVFGIVLNSLSGLKKDTNEEISPLTE